ncbi:hypothetical protein Q5752_001423 [Cryptotrichosporon argae]
MLLLVLAFLVAGLVAWGWRQLPKYTATPRYLRGPRPAHWYYGDQRALMQAPNGSLQTRWFDTYGSTLRYAGLFRRHVLLTKDPAAVDYVQRHAEVFLQPDATRQFSLDTMGQSLTAVEGEDHKRQRRVIGPSFGPRQIAQMSNTILDKAYELADVLAAHTDVDAANYVAQFAVDVIGLAAFDTHLDALGTGGNELLEAWRRMMAGNMQTGFWVLLQRAGVPLAKLFRTERSGAIDEAHAMMHRVGREMLAKKRAAIRAEGGMGKEDITGSDMITNLGDMATDVKASLRLSDDEVIAQIPLFLFSGNTTVAVTLIWAVGLLAKDPVLQADLRQEALAQAERPDWHALDALPHLDAFMSELLRVYPAAPTLFRVVQRDVALPLARPILDRRGRACHAVPLKRGAIVHIAYG